jgi:hypothetical protein
MPEEENYTVNCICGFCGHRWVMNDYLHPVDRLMELPRCERCWPQLKKGVIVRYGAPEQDPLDAGYADRHLNRDGLYTIAKVKQWQHGSWVYFEEIGDRQFNSALFTPKDFVKETKQ